EPGDWVIRREVSEGRGRSFDRGQDESFAAARKHDRRDRPGREYARRGLAAEPADHVSEAGKAGREDEDGEEDRPDHGISAGACSMKAPELERQLWATRGCTLAPSRQGILRSAQNDISTRNS